MSEVMGSCRGDPALISPLSEADREEVARMWMELFFAHETAGKPGRLVGSKKRLCREVHTWISLAMRSPDHIGFVVKQADIYRGFIALSVNTHPWLSPKRSGTVNAIWVEADGRRRGLGRQLVASALLELASRNIDTVDVHALNSLPASVLFWRSVGFADCAVQMQFKAAKKIARS